MPHFAYVGRNAQGNRVEGVMESPTGSILAEHLAESGITPIRIAPKSFGVRIEGDKGWIETNGRKIEASSPEIAKAVSGTGSTSDFVNHYRNFIDCVKSRGTPVESVEIGHRVSTACHLGNIAMKLDRKLRWDPKAEQFVGSDEANKMLQKPHRAPWSYA